MCTYRYDYTRCYCLLYDEIIMKSQQCDVTSVTLN